MSRGYWILPAGADRTDRDRTDRERPGDEAPARTRQRGPGRPNRRATLVVPGTSQGGPAQLAGAVTDYFTTAEVTGTHIVLIAAVVADLQTNVAAVCRYVVTDRDDVQEEAAACYGADRVLRVGSVQQQDIPDWINRLPQPEAHTIRRRIRRAVRTLPFVEPIYARIASRR